MRPSTLWKLFAGSTTFAALWILAGCNAESPPTVMENKNPPSANAGSGPGVLDPSMDPRNPAKRKKAAATGAQPE